MDSDLDIARATEPMNIEEVAKQLGLASSDLIFHGPHIAKVSWRALSSGLVNQKGRLILVTSVNPTPYGEGKTVTTIGLNQGLNHRGHNACCVIREPSLGPVFGIKGGGRRGVLPSHPHGTNQSAFHGGPPCHNIGPQPLLCDTRQSPPQREQIGN